MVLAEPKGMKLRPLAGSLLCAAILATMLPSPAAGQPPFNPWLDRRVLNMAHQGGELEAPSDTMYAFKTAVRKGAEVLELDVHATADGELVVLHDSTVDRTTGGTGVVDEMSIEQIKALDAAYWFVRGCGTCRDRLEPEYRFRGIATGARALPNKLKNFSPDDFKIPTLREVLETFPTTMINIEIKATAPDTAPYEYRVASILEEFGRTDDVLVVSFLDHAIEAFKVYAPTVHTATATVETAMFWASTQDQLPGLANERYRALQVPITEAGVTVVNQDFVNDAHSSGLAVHVWTINDRATMEWLIDIGVDGIMTDKPRLLEKVLGEKAVRFAG